MNESSTLALEVKNIGNQALTDLKAKLSVVSDHQVIFENQGSITIPSIPRFGAVTSTPLRFSLISGEVASALELSVEFEHADSNVVLPESFNISFTVNVDMLLNGNTATKQTDTLEDLTALYNWQQNVLDSVGDTEDFQQLVPPSETQLALGEDLGNQVMFIPNTDFKADVAVEGQPFTVANDSELTLSFWHAYDIEDEWDGGVVEIRIDDGDWQDVTDAGGVFLLVTTKQLQKTRPSHWRSDKLIQVVSN